MYKRMQQVKSNNVGSCWPTMLRPFSQGFKQMQRCRVSLRRSIRPIYCIYILGINSNNGGISNPACGRDYSVPQSQGASFFCRPSLYGRYVTILRPYERTEALNFCEVEVYSVRRGTEPSVSCTLLWYLHRMEQKYCS